MNDHPTLTTPAGGGVPADAALTLVGVTKRFPNGAGVFDVSFSARANRVCAVIGPNGSGKTVIFSLVCGLLVPDAGTISLASPGQRVGYCPDVPQFESWMTAVEIVELSLALAGGGSSMEPREAIDAVGLTRVMDRRVADYSRGMLQRLGIASALVLNPDVLILDEPSSALDPIGKSDIRSLIVEQRAERTIVLSSHSLEEVEMVADDVVVIAEGRVVDAGPTEDLLSRGVTPTWRIRTGSDVGEVIGGLGAAVPNARVRGVSSTVVEVSFESFAVGWSSNGLSAVVAALAASGVPVIEATLADRDLDAAFARIVEGGRRPLEGGRPVEGRWRP